MVPSSFEFSYSDIFIQLCPRTLQENVKEKPLPETIELTTSEASVGARHGIFNWLLRGACWITEKFSGERTGSIMFDAADGVLPRTNYILKVVAGPGRIEKEQYKISTEGRVFHLNFLPCQNCIQEIPH